VTLEKCNSVDAIIGQNIRVYRRKAGLSRAALAERICVPHRLLEKYERATWRISAARLLHIGWVLRVPVAAFFDARAKSD
jgi:transcriptional regulator with XRE-family HTH domain